MAATVGLVAELYEFLNNVHGVLVRAERAMGRNHDRLLSIPALDFMSRACLSTSSQIDIIPCDECRTACQFLVRPIMFLLNNGGRLLNCLSSGTERICPREHLVRRCHIMVELLHFFV